MATQFQAFSRQTAAFITDVSYYCRRRPPVRRKRHPNPPDKPGYTLGLQVVHGVLLGITVTLDYTVVHIVYIAPFVNAYRYLLYLPVLLRIYINHRLFFSYISKDFLTVRVPNKETFGLFYI